MHMNFPYAVLVMTDGRDADLDRSLGSLFGALPTPERWYIHDDTGSPAHRTQLRERYGRAWDGATLTVLGAGPRRGFGGAVRFAWGQVGPVGHPFVFHTEDDFTYGQSVPIRDMAHILADRPYLTQLALLRGPVNEEETAAGGIIEQHPDSYTVQRCRVGCCAWREHRRFWTTNPSLIPGRLIRDLEWPTGHHSEGHFTRSALQWGSRMAADAAEGNTGVWTWLEDAGQVAFWGEAGEGPRVSHIGHKRHMHGTGY